MNKEDDELQEEDSAEDRPRVRQVLEDERKGEVARGIYQFGSPMHRRSFGFIPARHWIQYYRISVITIITIMRNTD